MSLTIDPRERNALPTDAAKNYKHCLYGHLVLWETGGCGFEAVLEIPRALCAKSHGAPCRFCTIHHSAGRSGVLYSRWSIPLSRFGRPKEALSSRILRAQAPDIEPHPAGKKDTDGYTHSQGVPVRGRNR